MSEVYLICGATGGRSGRPSPPLLALETQPGVLDFLRGLRQSPSDPINLERDLSHLMVEEVVVFRVEIGMVYSANAPLTGPEIVAGKWWPEW